MPASEAENFYNFALYPSAPELARQLIETAQKNLKGQTDKYLLGDSALPHITLAHFAAAANSQSALWAALEKYWRVVVDIQFSHLYIRPGSGPLHTGKTWVGLSLMPGEDLINLQGAVFAAVQSLGLESSTLPAVYSPHLTFGRVPAAHAITISRMPQNAFWRESHPFCFSLGRADKFGVYAERFF